MPLSIGMKPGDTVELAKIETDEDAGLTKKDAAKQMEKLSKQLGELQELLYAAQPSAITTTHE
jgi:hypothetical protein